MDCFVCLSYIFNFQNYGAFLEKDGAGFRGRIKLTNSKNGDIDLTESSWTYQVFSAIFSLDFNISISSKAVTLDFSHSLFLMLVSK